MIHSRPVTASGLIVEGQGEYSGFTFRETGGLNRGIIRVRNGSATGYILDTVSIPANGSQSQHYGQSGIWAPDGIYVEIVSGTVEGAIRTSAA